MLIKIIYFILILLIIYIIYNNNNINYDEDENENENEEIEDFDDKKYIFPMEKIVCSKKCCSTQWPTSKNTQIIDSRINENDYLPTNLNCNDGINDTGCICQPKNKINN